MEKELKASKYSFWELIDKYRVEIPIIQRDYAQGRKEHEVLSNNFLSAIKGALVSENELNLDFIYGGLDSDKSGESFQPLDGQQRLTTLYLLHWYAYKTSHPKDSIITDKLLKFSYEIRISSREFCNALVCEDFDITDNNTISEQITNSNWFFLSWLQDSTIRAMLKMLDLIQKMFQDVSNLWDLLVEEKIVTFYNLILEDFGMSDDLYIKMNARGRLLSPFENLKAEIQSKNQKQGWERGIIVDKSFATKMDTVWTDFIWNKFQYNHNVDIAHMRLITTILMINIALGKTINLQPYQRNELIQKYENNSFSRDLSEYIDINVFNSIIRYYDLYSNTNLDKLKLPFTMWRHQPRKSIIDEILISGNNAVEDNSSYTQKVLFYAQTEYLINSKEFDYDSYTKWMRVIRNIVSRGDIDQNGKRPDIIRSPETFVGAINLISELSDGCDDIYRYLRTHEIVSSFAKNQMTEEKVKATIMAEFPQYKNILFSIEDNELLRGRISFALYCAGYDSKNIGSIDFSLLEKISSVFKDNFDNEKALSNDLRRAMLCMEEKGNYNFYEYWWSYWVVGSSTKRKLFSQFREIEYYISSEFKNYFKLLVLKLTEQTLQEIAINFTPPPTMKNWQVRLIKETNLLDNLCSSSYIAIPPDASFCYLLKSQRPRDINGSTKIE